MVPFDNQDCHLDVVTKDWNKTDFEIDGDRALLLVRGHLGRLLRRLRGTGDPVGHLTLVTGVLAGLDDGLDHLA
ncbi:hypothetical protein [Streptomyces sp. NPDC017964]|uniref:hypothetical protein n=1 Tax=Streptomyces sp. NPDC017964 TaxID=3365022 RepID=UPI00378BE9E6